MIDDKVFFVFVSITVVIILIGIVAISMLVYDLTFYRAMSGDNYKLEYDSREYTGCRSSEDVIDDEFVLTFSCLIK